MKVTYIEVCGFRAFGPAPCRLLIESNLAVIHAENSQGKTSLAESVEFLFTGETTRRSLLGGSPGEFENALRNAHLDDGDTVYVEVGLNDDTGVPNVLRRELVQDYRGASDCISRLTLNGSPCASVKEAGLQLSDPPLAAPVLLEHSLRYAVSAKPGERSDYFKALLEVADLDIVREEVARLITERDAEPRSPHLATLARLVSVDSLRPWIERLRRVHDLASVEAAFRGACQAVAPPSPGEDTQEPLTNAVERLRVAVQARQANVLPVAELLPGPLPPVSTHFVQDRPLPGSESSVEAVVTGFELLATEYRSRADTADRATADVLPLLRTALQIPTVTAISAGHPADCPLCLSPATLTQDRIDAVRAQIADQQGLSSGAASLGGRARALATNALATMRAFDQAIPAADHWTEDVIPAYAAAAEQLGATEHELQSALEALSAMTVQCSRVDDKRGELVLALEILADRADRMQAPTEEEVDNAVRALRSLVDEAEAVTRLHRELQVAAELLIEAVRSSLEARTDTDEWSALANLAAQPQSVADALAGYQHRQAAAEALKDAAKQIDRGIQIVLDQRLDEMTDEIRRWWAFLRPDELTAFDGITRKGAGRRYLDVTATLAPQLATPGVVRNALAVFSNSQLNALGLSTFLARCKLLGSDLVLLDDPVPGSDREHRSTFAAAVVGALLDDGYQVIITTHDSELARHLHTFHHHRGADEFKAVLLDPREGTRVLRTGDDFERLLLDAESQMHSPLDTNRRSAGNSLRIATERLAKLIIVHGRRAKGNASTLLSDYDNKNLRDLTPLVTAYAVDANEPGQWQMFARLLNDADHDTLNPPLQADLKHCRDSLRHLKRRHLTVEPNLMRP